MFIKGFLFVKEISASRNHQHWWRFRECWVQDHGKCLFIHMILMVFKFCVSRYHNYSGQDPEKYLFMETLFISEVASASSPDQDFQTGLLWKTAQFSSIVERSFCIKKSLSSRSKELIINQNTSHCFMLIYLDESSLLIKIEINFCCFSRLLNHRTITALGR